MELLIILPVDEFFPQENSILKNSELLGLYRLGKKELRRKKDEKDQIKIVNLGGLLQHLA